MQDEEEQNEGIIQEGVEAKIEQEIMGAEADGSTAREAEEEEEEITAKEQEEPEKQKRVSKTQKKKMAPKSKIKEEKLNVTGLSKQLEKQTNYLIKLEKALQPLGKLAKSSDATFRVIKEISTSVGQLEKQILQIQKIIKREKARK
jgi:hypothetical protein